MPTTFLSCLLFALVLWGVKITAEATENLFQKQESRYYGHLVIGILMLALAYALTRW